MAHVHTVVHTSGPLPFFAPVSILFQDRRAHGGYSQIETCSCGCVRESNHNQGAEEVGPWFEPAVLAEARAEGLVSVSGFGGVAHIERSGRKIRVSLTDLAYCASPNADTGPDHNIPAHPPGVRAIYARLSAGAEYLATLVARLIAAERGNPVVG